MALDYRVRTVPTAETMANCTICGEVLRLARGLEAPYILEREPANMEPGRAWGAGHLVVPAWREVPEGIVSVRGYNRLVRKLRSEMAARGG